MARRSSGATVTTIIGITITGTIAGITFIVNNPSPGHADHAD